MRSKKLDSGAAVLFESRDSGRCCAANDDRGVGFVDAVGFGRDVVDALKFVLVEVDVGAGAGSYFALEAAVGAVRCDGRLTGFVTSLGLGFEIGDVLVLVGFSGAPPVRAIEAAVGAVRELLLAFFAGAFSDVDAGDSVFVDDEEAFADDGVFGWLAGDLTALALDDVFDGAFVEMAAGLPLVIGFFASAVLPDPEGCVDEVRSSVTGGRASPPLTASSCDGSAGFISPGSSSAPVTGLSGFSGAFSSFRAGGLSCPSCPSPGFLIGVTTVLSTAPSGTNLCPCCSLTVLFKSLKAPSPSISLKLPLLSLAPLSLFSTVVAMPPASSTGTKLARTLLAGRYPFSLSLLRPLGERPRESGELESSVPLFSNIDRRLRTVEEDLFSEDMAADGDQNRSVQASNSGFRF